MLLLLRDDCLLIAAVIDLFECLGNGGGLRGRLGYHVAIVGYNDSHDWRRLLLWILRRIRIGQNRFVFSGRRHRCVVAIEIIRLDPLASRDFGITARYGRVGRLWRLMRTRRTGGRQTHRMIAYGKGMILGELIEGRGDLDPDAVVVVFGVAAGAQSSSPQAKEHGAYELAERGRIDGLETLLGAVVNVVVVEGAAAETAALGGLKVVDEPLDGDGRRLGRVRHVALELERRIVHVHRRLLVHVIDRLLLLLLALLLLLLLLMLLHLLHIIVRR